MVAVVALTPAFYPAWYYHLFYTFVLYCIAWSHAYDKWVS
jgi:hypothetical protein